MSVDPVSQKLSFQVTWDEAAGAGAPQVNVSGAGAGASSAGGAAAAAAAAPTERELKTYSLADVAPHNKESDIWVVVNGYVRCCCLACRTAVIVGESRTGAGCDYVLEGPPRRQAGDLAVRWQGRDCRVQHAPQEGRCAYCVSCRKRSSHRAQVEKYAEHTIIGVLEGSGLSTSYTIKGSQLTSGAGGAAAAAAAPAKKGGNAGDEKKAAAYVSASGVTSDWTKPNNTMSLVRCAERRANE